MCEVMTTTEVKCWLAERGFKKKEDLGRLVPSVGQPWIKTTAMFEAARDGKLDVCKYIVSEGFDEAGAFVCLPG
jgi:hypothetical protein